jgi:hemin uptake protein HemP
MRTTKIAPRQIESAHRGEQRSSSENVARVRSEELLGSAGVLIILHAGREYRLRQTSTGKLILTA